MSFKFKRKENTTDALHRLCASRVDAATRHVEKCETLEAVHRVRKEIKKLRSLLQLTRSGLRKSDYRRAARDIKQAAGYLAPARDAHVIFAAIGIVIEHFKEQLGNRPFADFKPALRKVCDEEELRLRKEHLPERVSRVLGRMQKNLDGAKLREEGWPVLCAGVKRSYADGRVAWKLALSGPAPENLHEWRKEVKKLWYQLRLLRPIWPEQLDAACSELKTLSEYLGDDHDLFMLQEAVREKCSAEVRASELELLCGLIGQRQAELRRAAMALGARFYAEKPSAFCERLGNYWQLWCRRTIRAGGKKRKIGKLVRSP